MVEYYFRKYNRKKDKLNILIIKGSRSAIFVLPKRYGIGLTILQTKYRNFPKYSYNQMFKLDRKKNINILYKIWYPHKVDILTKNRCINSHWIDFFIPII